MNIFKANVRLAWRAWKDREDPERPEEFTREEVAKGEVEAALNLLWVSLLGHLGVDDPERCADAEEVVKEEPFPLKEWDCVSFPMTGFIVRGKNLKPYNSLPPEKDLSKFCAERRLWLGIEVEFPAPLPKHAGAYAPDGSVMFNEDYDGEPPSFYAAVEEYYPVYAIKLAATTGE